MTRHEHGTNRERATERRQDRPRPVTLTRALKPVVFVAGAAPAAWLAWRAATSGLGANPIEAITLFTGRWALRFLLFTLAVTPLRRVTGWHQAIRFRRMLGLFAFFYATLHFATYVVVDQFFAWAFILADIAKRPYITVGFAAFVLLIPLAITSTTRWMARLGRRWQTLHRLVYASAIFGVVHFLWKVKADTRDPLTYGAILAGLLVARLPFRRLTLAGRRLASAVRQTDARRSAD